MKRLAALLFLIAILFVFAGCLKKDPGDMAGSSNNVVSDQMPNTGSETGDAVIDINELFEGSNSTEAGSSNSQIGTSTKDTTENDSSKAENNTDSNTVSTSSASGTSQIVKEPDTDKGYTSGWVR